MRIHSSPSVKFRDELQLFKDNNWKIVDAPPSVQSVEFHSPEVSNWISMNIISIDEETVIVEEDEENMIKLLHSTPHLLHCDDNMTL